MEIQAEKGEDSSENEENFTQREVSLLKYNEMVPYNSPAESNNS